MQINFIYLYIRPQLSVIWHVNYLWFFEKCSRQSFWLDKPLFTKSQILLKNTDPWNCLLVHVISSLEYILTYAEKQRFYLACFLKKTFNFWQKSYFFTPKWWYGVKMYKPLNQSIIIHDLTCKLCLVLLKKFMTKFWVKPLFIKIVIFY